MNKHVSPAQREAGGQLPPTSAAQSRAAAAHTCASRGRRCQDTRPGEAQGTGSWSRHAARWPGGRGLHRAGDAQTVRPDAVRSAVRDAAPAWDTTDQRRRCGARGVASQGCSCLRSAAV